MSPRLALLAAIHDLPDDDLPRLAYADWMEEDGHERRAEFIRVHLAMDRTPKGTPEYRRLWEREVDLIRTHKDEWFGTFRANWDFYEVKRGFLDDISSAAPHVVPHLGWLLENHAVQRLVVGSPDLEALPELLASPLVATLRQLRYVHSLTGGYFSEYATPALPGADLPLARRPLDVSVAGHRAGPRLADLLAESPHLGRMARLDVSENTLGAEGAAMLLDGMTRWPMLTELSARAALPAGRGRRVGANLGAAGIAALVSNPAAARLRILNLLGEDVGPAIAEALLDSPHLDALAELRLSHMERRHHALTRRLNEHFAGRIQWAGEEPG